MRFVIDMNLSPKWVDVLEKSGFGATHWSKLGAPHASDSEIMAFAKANGFVVMTNDLDFGSILAATGGDSPSVVQIRADDCRVESIAQLVVRSISQTQDQLATGALVTIETSKLRITSLPIEGLT